MKKFLSIFFALIISLTTGVMFGCGKDNNEEISDYKYDDVAYEKFNEISTAKYLIPGLDDDFIPQGMDYWDSEDLVIVSGYYKENNDKHPSSVLYTISGKTGKVVNKFNVKNVDDTYHTSHAGGVAVTNKNLFISNSFKLFRISLTQLKNSSDNLLKIDEVIKVPVRASYCNFSNNILWVGDFYVNGSADYALPQDRPIVEGKSKAEPWTVGYTLSNTENDFGDKWDTDLEYATPDFVILSGEQVQGFSFVNAKLALSKSYNRKNNSTIVTYENPLSSANFSTVLLNEKAVPVYNISRIEIYKTMPLSEGVCCKENKLLVLFESGAKFFKEDGAVNPTEHIWEMIIPN